MQVFFFFQAEDGIRDLTVTGVQTCALPILSILQKQKSRDPSLGYAKDFIPLMERILPIVAERRIKITADRKSTRLNSSHSQISYAVFCLKKKKIGLHVAPQSRGDRLSAPHCSES